MMKSLYELELTSSRLISPGWLPGPHLQTIFPLLRKGLKPSYLRERIETSDDDFIDLDWINPEKATKPLVVLFHGLEGSSRSHYALSLMRAIDQIGWRGVVVHFRGCSGAPNRQLRAYHSGDSAEISWLLATIRERANGASMFAVGVSLGGNALLKCLGEQASQGNELINAAASVCAPLDLTISGHALAKGFNRVYTHHFLATLKAKAEEKHARFRGGFDIDRARRARTLHAFDDAYTAPVHGFADANDYWSRASSKPWLRFIKVPTLLLSAANDPFVPAAALPDPTQLPPAVRFETSASGGHVGFLSGPMPGHLNWLPSRLLGYFQQTILEPISASQ